MAEGYIGFLNSVILEQHQKDKESAVRWCAKNKPERKCLGCKEVCFVNEKELVRNDKQD